MEEIDIDKLYRDARAVAAETGIKDEDLTLMGLDPKDPLQYVRGVGDHLFISCKNMEPLGLPTWKKLKPWWVGRWYKRSTDYLAGIFDEPQ